MKKGPQPEVLQNYVVPIVLAIVILAISQLFNLVKIANLVEACVLCAMVISGLFVGQYVAFRALRVQERDALYGILSTISFSGPSHMPTSRVLAEADILRMESASHEVWIYAYDLNYENFDRSRSPFTNAVVTNLKNNIKYKYLIPDSQEIRLRHNPTLIGSVAFSRFLARFWRWPATVCMITLQAWPTRSAATITRTLCRESGIEVERE